MDMIYGSYFATIIWDPLLNYYCKLYFIIHLHNWKYDLSLGLKGVNNEKDVLKFNLLLLTWPSYMI